MRRNYIPRRNLPQLDAYKYSSVDHSLLSRYLLQPYWSRLVLLFPTWIAPNCITLAGLVCIIVNVATLIYYDPRMDGQCPHWVYWTWAAGMWTYMSLDAIDGKQARRTGMSGPLGQLFDHGCDALNVALGSLLASEAGQLGATWWLIGGLIGAQFNFYVSTWEEYHTGTLYLSAFSGPVEGVVILIAMLVVTGFAGPSFWNQSVGSFLRWVGFPAAVTHVLPLWPIKYVMFAVSQATVLLNLVASARNIRDHLRQQQEQEQRRKLVAAEKPATVEVNTTSDKPAKAEAAPASPTQPTPHRVNPALHRVVGRLAPCTHIPLLMCASFYLRPALLTRHVIPIVLYFGFAFSYLVGRIIVSHVAAMRFPRGNRSLHPWFVYTALLTVSAVTPLRHAVGSTAIAVVDALVSDACTVWWVYGSCVWGAAVYFWFAYRVVQDICNYSDMWCFRVKYYGQERPPRKRVDVAAPGVKEE